MKKGRRREGGDGGEEGGGKEGKGKEVGEGREVRGDGGEGEAEGG